MNAAKRNYAMIEHAAFEASMDIMAGLRGLPQALLSKDLQKSRVLAARRVREEKPEELVNTFIPLFL